MLPSIYERMRILWALLRVMGMVLQHLGADRERVPTLIRESAREVCDKVERAAVKQKELAARSIETGPNSPFEDAERVFVLMPRRRARACDSVLMLTRNSYGVRIDRQPARCGEPNASAVIA